MVSHPREQATRTSMGVVLRNYLNFYDAYSLQGAGARVMIVTRAPVSREQVAAAGLRHMPWDPASAR